MHKNIADLSNIGLKYLLVVSVGKSVKHILCKIEAVTFGICSC